ncbi:MAG TPA: glycosyltransferase family 4 protein [Pseudolabrys sp.]|nr:glycosyltransferase family 4 protein [Pseudolabrys sp.]
MEPLKVLHVFRAPVGGLFRHVIDLTRAQIGRGYRVGLIADSETGGERAEEIFQGLKPQLALGLTRIPMPRHPGIGDLAAALHVRRRVGEVGADIVHGHGAKGGLYARLVSSKNVVRAYTPHGGTLVFDDNTAIGKLYFMAERVLMPRTDLFLFESQFSADKFRRKIGSPARTARIVHNGVSPDEFEPVTLAPDATDLLFLGELRILKGVDVLLDALALLRDGGRTITATLIGDGPDRRAFLSQIERLRLGKTVRLMPPMPARKAFAAGRVMVVASRAESFPYVVLEAAAAGKPLIATQVGGIPEIFGPSSDALIPGGNVSALATAIGSALNDTAASEQRTRQLRERVGSLFTVNAMVDGVLAAYRDARESRRR